MRRLSHIFGLAVMRSTLLLQNVQQITSKLTDYTKM